MSVPKEYEMARNRVYIPLIFHLNLLYVADGDVVTSFVPGFVGSVVRTFWVVGTPDTTGGKATTLNVEIGTVNLTGGAISLTSALCTPMGKVISGTAVTGGNNFNKDSLISVEASSTTAFAEGDGTLVLMCEASIY